MSKIITVAVPMFDFEVFDNGYAYLVLETNLVNNDGERLFRWEIRCTDPKVETLYGYRNDFMAAASYARNRAKKRVPVSA